jgi:hypothetical protein
MRVLAPGFVMYVGDELRPKPYAFRNTGEGNRYGMSSDWCHYCPDPQETRRRVRQRHKPEEYGVVSLSVGKVRSFRKSDEHTKQDVIHDPIWCGENHPDNNHAHSLVTGPKSRKSDDISPEDESEIRNWYSLHSMWAIPPAAEYLPAGR